MPREKHREDVHESNNRGSLGEREYREGDSTRTGIARKSAMQLFDSVPWCIEFVYLPAPFSPRFPWFLHIRSKNTLSSPFFSLMFCVCRLHASLLFSCIIHTFAIYAFLPSFSLRTASFALSLYQERAFRRKHRIQVTGDEPPACIETFADLAEEP